MDDLSSAPFGTPHPLMHKWRAWAYLGQDAGTACCSFSTVEGFWNTRAGLPDASVLKPGANLAYFRQPASPVWEDPAHLGGGKWVLCLPDRYPAKALTNVVLTILLCLVGHTLAGCGKETHSTDLEAKGCVLGFTVQIRRGGTRLSLWTAGGTNDRVLLLIGQALKEHSMVAKKTVARFTRHVDAIASNSAYGAKSALTV
jgi:hypothetical protein